MDEKDTENQYDPKIFMVKLTILQDKWRQEVVKTAPSNTNDKTKSKSRSQMSKTDEDATKLEKSGDNFANYS